MSATKRIWNAARSAGVGMIARRAAGHWPFPVRVTVEGGRQMYVDLRSPIGRGLFVSGTFDMEAIKPAIDALGEGATFLDVGANIGFYSVLALDRVGSKGKIYSFEIDQRPLRCLRKTIAGFGYSNIHVVEAAVADIDGTLSFQPKTDHGHNHIECNDAAAHKVMSTRLDTWATRTGLSNVAAIKIDVEGAEMLVLEGARETIARFKPLLLCECDEKMARAFGYTPRDLIALLEGFGYTTAWLDGVYSPTLLARNC